jgi:hypothetical protein
VLTHVINGSTKVTATVGSTGKTELTLHPADGATAARPHARAADADRSVAG